MFFGPLWDMFVSFPLHSQTDLSPAERHEDNLKWQWDKFHFVVNCLFNYFSPLCSSWLTWTRLLLWQRSLTSRLKYANCYLSFQLTTVRYIVITRKCLIQVYMRRTQLLTFIIFLNKVNPIWHDVINVQVQYRLQSILYSLQQLMLKIKIK